MSDFDRDPRVADLLDGVGAAVAGHLTPPGVDTVYTTVRQRRRNRAVAAGVLALALLGGPSVGFALANDGGGTPPIGGDPSMSASVEPPRPSPSPSASASPTPPAAQDGRISLAELKRTNLDLPPWQREFSPCKAGDGEIQGQPVYSDVDHDGAEETAVVLWCRGNGEYRVFKVMVFDRDTAGEIVTLGQVLEAPISWDEGAAVIKVWGIQAAAGGQIRVDVGDYAPCCGTAPDLAQHQWRTYGWDGRRFTQTGGPAKFGPNPKITDLRVTTGDLVMTKQADGRWRGQVTFTVRNAGPFPAHVDINLSGDRLVARGDRWTGWDGALDNTGPRFYARRMIGELAAGQSRTFTLDLTSIPDPTGTLDIGVGHVMAGGVDDRGYPDKKQSDNRAKAPIRAA